MEDKSHLYQNEREFQDYIDGSMDSENRSHWHEHVKQCSECASRIWEVVGVLKRGGKLTNKERVRKVLENMKQAAMKRGSNS